jgi:AcrR family transcriptional regulator
LIIGHYFLEPDGSKGQEEAMARRSDHSRQELGELILEQAHAHMAEVGFARFSAREVAKRVGYVLGTIYNVYGTLDRLIAAVNTRTFAIWADALQAALDRGGEDRMAVLVAGYFDFARRHRNLWNAIYDHHLPQGGGIDDDQAETRGRLTGIVVREVAAALPDGRRSEARDLANSLIAVVHGHCAMETSGSFLLMGVEDPQGIALSRVREAIASRSSPEKAA